MYRSANLRNMTLKQMIIFNNSQEFFCYITGCNYNDVTNVRLGELKRRFSIDDHITINKENVSSTKSEKICFKNRLNKIIQREKSCYMIKPSNTTS